MAGPDGPQQQGLRRGDSRCGLGRTPRGNSGRDCTRRAGGCGHVQGSRGGVHSTRAGDGGVDPGRASTDADREGTAMSWTPDLEPADAVAGHRWLSDHTWRRPKWTVAELVAAKGNRT